MTSYTVNCISFSRWIPQLRFFLLNSFSFVLYHCLVSCNHWDMNPKKEKKKKKKILNKDWKSYVFLGASCNCSFSISKEHYRIFIIFFLIKEEGNMISGYLHWKHQDMLTNWITILLARILQCPRPKLIMGSYNM